MDWKERLIELSNSGLKDKDVATQLFVEFGVVIADDTVRYYARRKGKKEIVKAELKNNGISKTLVLFDLHIPFHRENDIIDIILKHRNEIDTIIFGGDLMDCEAISVYPKEGRGSLVNEMMTVHRFLKRIDKLTPNVKKILMWGNHEYRYVRYLAEHSSELNALHSDNVLQEVVDGFTHYDKRNKKKTIFPPLSDNFEIINKWYYKHGDMIVAHPKNNFKNLRLFFRTVEYFVKQGKVFNTLLIGHTHKWGVSSDFGKWGGECGCLCVNMDYADNGNINYTSQQYGYALITQINGITDINKSRIFKLSFEEGEQTWQESMDDQN
jgi:predicted phosphodiesterase